MKIAVVWEIALGSLQRCLLPRLYLKTLRKLYETSRCNIPQDSHLMAASADLCVGIVGSYNHRCLHHCFVVIVFLEEAREVYVCL
jgi:hypothetical protein